MGHIVLAGGSLPAVPHNLLFLLFIDGTPCGIRTRATVLKATSIVSEGRSRTVNTNVLVMRLLQFCLPLHTLRGFELMRRRYARFPSYFAIVALLAACVQASPNAGATQPQLCTSAAATSTDAVTYKYDVMRSGQNLTETALTPCNVTSATFGKLRNLMVDGLVDASRSTFRNSPRPPPHTMSSLSRPSTIRSTRSTRMRGRSYGRSRSSAQARPPATIAAAPRWRRRSASLLRP